MDNNAAGALREKVANSYYERNGFKALDGKCGSNCFDGVYVRGDQVIISEVKPLKANGSISLNPAKNQLPTQGTTEWVKDRANLLLKSSDPEKVKVGKIIINAEKNGQLTTVVSGVDKNNMIMVRVKP